MNGFEPDELLKQQQAFGYTFEDLKMILAPMAANGQEPVGSMGTDTPLAVLSDKSQLLFNYFKQLFAQVTNPPIDPIREEMVMSAETTIGAEQNLFEEIAASLPPASAQAADPHQRRTRKDQAAQRRRASRTITLPTLYPRRRRRSGTARRARPALPRGASDAIEEGYTIIVLSDRGVNAELRADPGLLATGAVHHHLIREGHAHALRHSWSSRASRAR